MYTGTWSKQHLLKPVEGKIGPMIGPGCALYQSGNDFYAFSGLTGKWGVLHLEGDAKSQGMISTHDISVQQGNKLYVFSLKHGEWSKGVAINSGHPSPIRHDPRLPNEPVRSFKFVAYPPCRAGHRVPALLNFKGRHRPWGAS